MNMDRPFIETNIIERCRDLNPRVSFCSSETEQNRTMCTIWNCLSATSSAVLKKKHAPEEDLNFIKQLIRMGIGDPTPCCVGVSQRFCEQVFVINACHFGNEETIELMEEFLGKPELREDITKWHYLSRGALMAFNNFVGAGSKTPEEFDERFKALIMPYTLGYFSSNIRPVNLEFDLNREVALLDLLRLYVVMREQQGNFTWALTLEWWTNIFFNCCDPVLLLGYVDFVRSRGSASESLGAIKFALNQISEGGELKLLWEMRCHVKLLKDRLDIVVTQQDPETQMEAAREFQSKLTLYSKTYANEFSDIVSGLKINDFCVLKNSDEDTVWDSEMADNSYDSNAESNDIKVFVTNLSYQATEKDLSSALEEMNIYPKNTKILKDNTGKSRGFAHLLFNSKENADNAIGLSKQVKVCERIIFMTPFQDNPRAQSYSAFNSSSKVKATLLIITNASKEFMDEKKVYAAIAQYGHVKDLQITSKNPESFTLKIEFHMPEDAILVKNKITENQILGPEALCRMGYPSKKEDAKKAPKKTPKKNQLESKMDVSSDDAASNPLSDTSTAEDTPKNPETLKPTRPIKRTFIPRQAKSATNQNNPDQPNISKRSRMKSRLDVVVASESSAGNSSGDPNSTAMEVETSNEKARDQDEALDESELPKEGKKKKKQLTNDDFRKLFKQ